VMRESPAFRALTRFLIQGIMVPKSRNREFHEELLKIEQEYHMPFLTIYEKEAMEKGEAIGEARGEARAALRTRHDAIERILRVRLPDISAELIARVQAIEDLGRLDDLLVRAALAHDTAEFATALP